MTVIAAAKSQDLAALADLMAEMDQFYGDITRPHDARLKQIAEALFGEPPYAYALLAWNADQLVGLAAYSFLWPAVGATRSLYLKELYVAEAHRKTGVGKLLMARIFAIAAEHECSRIEWATDESNENAKRFYAELGYEPHPGKVSYRVAR